MNEEILDKVAELLGADEMGQFENVDYDKAENEVFFEYEGYQFALRLERV